MHGACRFQLVFEIVSGVETETETRRGVVVSTETPYGSV